MTTLLAETNRRAAHGLHVCRICHEPIARGETYLDQRCAEDGTAWTFRCHIACNTRYWKVHRAMELYDDELVEWSEILEWEANEPPAPVVVVSDETETEETER